jgi:hypothetical protein
MTIKAADIKTRELAQRHIDRLQARRGAALREADRIQRAIDELSQELLPRRSKGLFEKTVGAI